MNPTIYLFMPVFGKFRQAPVSRVPRLSSKKWAHDPKRMSDSVVAEPAALPSVIGLA